MRSLTLEDQVLKTDRRGRVRVPRERREALLAEFQRSGVSAAEFARLVGVKYATFAGWVVQQRRRETVAEPSTPAPTAASSRATTGGSGPVQLFEAVVEAFPPSRAGPGGGAAGRRARAGERGPGADGPRSCCGSDADRRPAMLSFTGGLKVFVAVEPCDLRKSFSGLQALVSERLGEDLRQGALFVFTNRRHTRLKILYWDGTGVWLLSSGWSKGPSPGPSRSIRRP